MVPSVDREHPSGRGGHRSRQKAVAPHVRGSPLRGRGASFAPHGYAQPDDARAHEGEGVIHAGSWRHPCRERVRASNLKGARLRLLDDPIGHDGHRRAGQVAPTPPARASTTREGRAVRGSPWLQPGSVSTSALSLASPSSNAWPIILSMFMKMPMTFIMTFLGPIMVHVTR